MKISNVEIRISVKSDKLIGVKLQLSKLGFKKIKSDAVNLYLCEIKGSKQKIKCWIFSDDGFGSHLLLCLDPPSSKVSQQLFFIEFCRDLEMKLAEHKLLKFKLKNKVK